MLSVRHAPYLFIYFGGRGRPGGGGADLNLYKFVHAFEHINTFGNCNILDIYVNVLPSFPLSFSKFIPDILEL